MPKGRAEHFPDLHEYVVRHASPEITRRQMLQMAQRDIDPRINGDHVRRIYRIEKLPSKDGTRWNLLIPDDKAEDFMKLIPGRSSEEIQRLAKDLLGLELTLAQIRTWKKNHKTPSGYDARFRPGNASPTKGKKRTEFLSPEMIARIQKTQFKKGNVPKNRREVGEIIERSDGYLWIKTQDWHQNDNWQQYHRWLWEQVHGPIPEGFRVYFLDGDRRNCKIENLELVSEAVAATAAKFYGLTKDAEINKAILKAATLKVALTKAQERVKK